MDDLSALVKQYRFNKFFAKVGVGGGGGMVDR